MLGGAQSWPTWCPAPEDLPDSTWGGEGLSLFSSRLRGHSDDSGPWQVWTGAGRSSGQVSSWKQNWSWP